MSLCSCVVITLTDSKNGPKNGAKSQIPRYSEILSIFLDKQPGGAPSPCRAGSSIVEIHRTRGAPLKDYNVDLEKSGFFRVRMLPLR